jgi:MEDS: MEthanogen/methylotroph, DcmR Sensory domain
MALPELTREILNLRPGHHLCLFYEKDPSEQMPALVPFIQDALSSDEQFVYIADDQTVEELEVLLKQSGINVAKECDRGALNFGLAGNGASRTNYLPQVNRGKSFSMLMKRRNRASKAAGSLSK